jgi:hypothetical protein
MPIPLIVNNETFEYPINRDPPGWGSEATAWAVAVTNELSGIIGPQDIPNTVAAIANNVVSPTSIPGLAFSTASVKGATVYYNIYRVTSTNEVVEQGIMLLSYLPNAMTWDLVVLSSRSSNVTLSITNTGQVQYVDDNMPGLNYSGSITFRAIGLT